MRVSTGSGKLALDDDDVTLTAGNMPSSGVNRLMLSRGQVAIPLLPRRMVVAISRGQEQRKRQKAGGLRKAKPFLYATLAPRIINHSVFFVCYKSEGIALRWVAPDR